MTLLSNPNDRIDKALYRLSTLRSFDAVVEVVGKVLEIMDLEVSCEPELFKSIFIDRHIRKFTNAPSFRKQPAAYTISTIKNIPVEVSLYGVKDHNQMIPYLLGRFPS